MKTDSIVRHLLLVLAAALGLYLAAYLGIEHLRNRKGGWQVTFRSDAGGVPSVSISQPRLGISKVSLLFPDQRLASSNFTRTVVFDRPKTNVPFGRVIYLDTTFLPGSVVFDLFGHQVELAPRTLFIDKQEVSWRPGSRISLTAPEQSGESGSVGTATKERREPKELAP